MLIMHWLNFVAVVSSSLVDCKASGSPTPEISWSLPDGTVINNAMLADDSGRRSRRYVLFDNGTLYLNKAGVTEGGDYTCYAQNTLGRDEMTIHVTVVMAAPQIKHNYKTHMQVKAGDAALLDCEAVGEPKPKIFWLLPSSDMISSSTARYLLHVNGSLSVSRVKLLDAGEYMCVARNPGGDDTKLYKLDVVAKPPIINGLYMNKTIMTVTAVRHSKKQIDCRAEGTPPPQIMWIMPDNIFLTAPYYGSRIVVHKNGTLEIRNIRPSDTAEFICVARNDGGESMLVVQLEVVEMLRRPTFKNPFNEKIIAKPGKATTLNCSVDGNPPPDISWMLPNAPYYGSRIVVHKNGTLEIRNIRPSDTAEFICVARNDGGESMLVVQLEVVEMLRRPTFKNPFNEKIIAKPGKATTLNCSVDGNPPPDISWMLPNGTWFSGGIKTSQFLTGSHGTLTISSPDTAKAGRYRCAAKNKVGYIEKLLIVEVGQKPNILTRPAGPVKGISGELLQWGIPSTLCDCHERGSHKPRVSENQRADFIMMQTTISIHLNI
uniref:Immunoglobulin superfamily member 10 n=1 Tax=Bubo bubo TaxID=30461 RepID=A0A8C0ESZ2_BUBBB